MLKNTESSSDRRQSPRTKLVEIAYIGMGPENGGLVLDVSDGGLSFHSVAPVRRAETIRFLLSLRGHSRIEGTGQVMWTNEMRTVCGIKFTSLSSGAREHLNNWTNQSRMPVAAEDESLSSSAPSTMEIEDETQTVEASSASEPDINTQPVFAVPPIDRIFLSQPEATVPRGGSLFLKLMLGFLGVALAVAAYLYGVQVGRSENGFGAGSALESGAQPGPSRLAPASVAASPVASEPPSSPAVTAPSPTAESPVPTAPGAAQNVGAPPGRATLVNASKTSDPTGSKLAESEANKHGPVASHGMSPSDLRAQQEAAKAELAAALAYLNGDNGERNKAKAVQQLWQAVRNGNTEAEVYLSDLYVTGDGVEKNCEQARILLTAASKNGNVPAKVKLEELIANGCE